MEAGTPVSQAVYAAAITYAPNGNVVAANDLVNGNWGYSYDDFNRLVGATPRGATCAGGAQSLNWQYDRAGNRWQQNGAHTMHLTFDANNRMTPDSGHYDAAGNLIAYWDGLVWHNYTYDAENRLITADGATYTYDAEGRRVRKVASGAVTDYVYDGGGRAVAEVNGSGAAIRQEVYAGGRHVATISAGVTVYAHVDWLGTERARTSAVGVRCLTTANDPFGDNQTSTGGCDVSPQHFTGKERDPESGLDYFGARYYMSGVARFVTADWSGVPIPVPYAKLENPQTLNLYSYVGNNPVSGVDADGHQEAQSNTSNGNTGLRPNGTTQAVVPQQQARVLIIVGDPGLEEHNQGRSFNRAAQTRAQELEAQGVQVTVVRASNVDTFASAMKNNGTLNGVEYFGHASWDRLYVGETAAKGTNIDSSNVGKLSGANLAPNATLTIHACFAENRGQTDQFLIF